MCPPHHFSQFPTSGHLCRPAFLPTWPFTACTPPCAPFRTPLCTSMHLHASLRTSVHPCTTFALHFPGLVTLIRPSILTSDPFGYPGQLSPSATRHNAHPRTSVAPIWSIHFSLWACTTHIAIQGPCLAGSPLPKCVMIHNMYWSLLDLLPMIPDQTHRPWKHPGRSKQKDQIRQPELGCKTQMLVSVRHHI